MDTKKFEIEASKTIIKVIECISKGMYSNISEYMTLNNLSSEDIKEIFELQMECSGYEIVDEFDEKYDEIDFCYSKDDIVNGNWNYIISDTKIYTHYNFCSEGEEMEMAMEVVITIKDDKIVDYELTDIDKL